MNRKPDVDFEEVVVVVSDFNVGTFCCCSCRGESSLSVIVELIEVADVVFVVSRMIDNRMSSLDSSRALLVV